MPDENYLEDAGPEGRLNILGLNATSYTWLASRCVHSLITGEICFLVRSVLVTGKVYESTYLCDFNKSYVGDSWDPFKSFYDDGGLRPVFLIDQDVSVLSGTGLKEDPYIIGYQD